MAAVVGLAWWAPAIAQQAPAPEIGEHLAAARAARERCDWEHVAMRATSTRASAPRGSDAWFEASALFVEACYQRWEPRELMATYREVMAAEIERERGGLPGVESTRERFGPLTPAARAHVASIELAAARVLQSEGKHDAALMYFDGAVGRVQSGPTDDGISILRDALLDSTRSLLALGHTEQAATALHWLRDDFAGSNESAIAVVLLEQTSEGDGAYRGKYAGDEAHGARVKAVRERLPAARKRLAAALGCDEARLARFAVGVADTPAGMSHAGAFTDGDPRRPDLAPVIVLFSEPLALGTVDAEQILVHELAHAALLDEFGLEYERWPGWMVEGLPQGFAGQWETNAQYFVEQRLMADPERFGGEDFWVRFPLEIGNDPCGGAVTPEEALVASLLEPREAPGGVAKLLAELRRGAPLDAALAQVPGASRLIDASFVRGQIERRLSSIRQSGLPAIRRLVDARYLGPQASLERADEVLKSERAPLARGFAMWERARSLEFLGQHVDADRAYDELLAARCDHPAYADLAMTGKVRCALAAGRKDEAERLLRAILRDSISGQLAEWARGEMAKLARAR